MGSQESRAQQISNVALEVGALILDALARIGRRSTTTGDDDDRGTEKKGVHRVFAERASRQLQMILLNELNADNVWFGLLAALLSLLQRSFEQNAAVTLSPEETCQLCGYAPEEVRVVDLDVCSHFLQVVHQLLRLNAETQNGAANEHYQIARSMVSIVYKFNNIVEWLDDDEYEAIHDLATRIFSPHVKSAASTSRAPPPPSHKPTSRTTYGSMDTTTQPTSLLVKRQRYVSKSRQGFVSMPYA